MNISALWAKKSKKGYYWLPLTVHLTDTAETAKKLWRKWLPESVRRMVEESINGDESEAEKPLVFLAAAHDIGKATPVFQAAMSSFSPSDLDEEIYNNLLFSGFTVRKGRKKYSSYKKSPHALASQYLLRRASDLGLADSNLAIHAAVIAGAHHGKPSNSGWEDQINRKQAQIVFPAHAGVIPGILCTTGADVKVAYHIVRLNRQNFWSRPAL